MRLGLVVGEALARAAARKRGELVDVKPLGLLPGKAFYLCDESRTETISVKVPRPSYDAFLVHVDGAPTAAVYVAVVQLLQDLNYRFVPSLRLYAPEE